MTEKIKNILKRWPQIFMDAADRFSSTRVGGLSCIWTGCVGFLIDTHQSYEVNHIALDILILGGLALLGVKDWKKNNVL